MKWNNTDVIFPRVWIRSTVFILVTVPITSLYNGGLKNRNFVVKIYRCFTVKTVEISSDIAKLQGDFHFSFGTSTKRSEQPQGDFFALQREPCALDVYMKLDYFFFNFTCTRSVTEKNPKKLFHWTYISKSKDYFV
jgi:hypothetical protein